MQGRRVARIIAFAVLIPATSIPSLYAQMHPDYWEIGKRNINKGWYGFPNKFTPEQECRSGFRLDGHIRLGLTVSRHPEVESYLQSLCDLIRIHSDYRGQVHVCLCLQQPYLIAALMGGYLYVDEELIRRAKNEAELAGALAHEIGHLAAEHPAENTTRSELLQDNPACLRIMWMYAMAFTPPRTTNVLASFWQAVNYMNEIEADELATQYLWNSGFDPEGLSSLLSHIHNYLCMDRPPGLRQSITHPPLKLREERIYQAAKALSMRELIRINSSEFIKAQSQLGRTSIRLSASDNGDETAATLNRKTLKR